MLTRIARLAFGVVLLTAVTTSCSTLRPASCGPGQEPAVQELVYFGTQTPSGHVTPQEWSVFLADTVTPRFPAGLTAWQASGQWRSDVAGLVHEPSYVLSLVHPRDGASETAVAGIVEVYKHRFQQEAVLRVRSDVCMGL